MASQAPSPSLLLYFLVRVLLLFPPYKISIDPGEAKGRPYKSYQPTSPYLCNPFILSPKRCLIIVVSKLEKYSLQTNGISKLEQISLRKEVGVTPNTKPVQMSSFYLLLLANEQQAVYKGHGLNSLNLRFIVPRQR